MEDVPDEELVAAAIAGRNANAFGELVRRHQSRLRRWLTRLCGDRDCADDLAQDTFVKAYDKLHTFSGRGRFQSWLFKIAYTTFLEDRRRNHRRAELIDRLVKPAAALAASEAQESSNRALDTSMDLTKLLASLDEAEQRILILFYGFGFSHQEVAGIVKQPLGTVKSQIHRAKARLRQTAALGQTGS
ncbi:MAG: RNA polymerase sigma factor [Gammaproteobacteria bacterium]